MATFTAKIGSLDIAPYVRVAPGDGLDPANSSYLEPSFAESPLRDGGPLINIDAHNREIIFPVALSAVSKDALHALVQSINNEMQRPGIDFEWKDQGASNSTFFDIQSGRMDVEYNFRRAQKFWLFATIHLWTAPHGHTGTSRLIGSISSSGAVQSFVPTLPIAGDMGAQAVWNVTAGSQVMVDDLTNGRYVGVGVLPASYVHLWSPASMTSVGALGTTTGNASGAQGQIWGGANAGFAIPDTDILGRITLPAADAYVGRNRIYAIGRSRADSAIPFWISDWENKRIAATAIASGVGNWHLYDLGVLNVPTSGRPSQLQISFHAYGGNNQFYNSAVGQAPIHINQVIILPENQSALLVDDVDLASMMIYDSFNDTTSNSGLNNGPLLTGHVTDTGHTWATGYNRIQGGASSLHVHTDSGGLLTAQATPGRFNEYGARIFMGITNYHMEYGFKFDHLFGAPSVFWGLRRERSSTEFLGVRFGPSQSAAGGGAYIAVEMLSGGISSIIASKSIATINENFRHRLLMDISTDEANFTSTVSGAVIVDDVQAPAGYLLASVAGQSDTYQAGDPGIYMSEGTRLSTNEPFTLYDFRVTSLPSQRIAPRDVYVLDGVNGEVYRRSLTGDVQQRLTHKLRGQIPKIPPSTQAQRIVGFTLGMHEGTANDVTDVSVSVREQFRFAR